MVARAPAVTLEPEQTARAAHLRYVSGDEAGLTRHRHGRGFCYRHADGSRVCDSELREWIRSLAIPPAWTQVWIAPYRNAHILATGRDAKGRKQYIYHPRWQALRRESYFHRLHAFGESLPRLRRRIDADLRRPGLSRERVVALVVHLLQTTLVRVGNPEYVQQNESYGLTTLTDEHLQLEGRHIVFEFRGKSGQWHEVDLRDARAARAIRRCQELPGQDLFQYVDAEGRRHGVDSSDVNAYLSASAGEEFTAKVFRTWGGSATLVRILLEMERPGDTRTAERQLKEAIKQTARILRNTPAVCQRHYVHPLIGEAYLGGKLWACRERARGPAGLQEEEQVLLCLLSSEQQAASGSA